MNKKKLFFVFPSVCLQRVTFSLTQLEVKDLFTDKAVFQHLLKIRSGDDVSNKRMPSMNKVSGAATPQQGAEDANPLVTVNVAISKTTLDVEMWAVPTDVVYNRWAGGCVGRWGVWKVPHCRQVPPRMLLGVQVCVGSAPGVGCKMGMLGESLGMLLHPI